VVEGGLGVHCCAYVQTCVNVCGCEGVQCGCGGRMRPSKEWGEDGVCAMAGPPCTGKQARGHAAPDLCCMISL